MIRILSAAMILILTGSAPKREETKLLFGRIGKRLSEQGKSVTMSDFQRVEVFLSGDGIRILVSGRDIEEWSTVMLRSVGSYPDLAFIIAAHAAEKDIRCLDRYWEHTNDITKLVQAYRFSRDGIPSPKTYYSPSYEPKHITNAIRFLGFPLVVKRCHTAKGEGVSLAHDETSLVETLSSHREQSKKNPVILQEFIENEFEYRVFVTGDTIATAERKRRTGEGEFRNNVHLGAEEEFFDPSLLPDAIRAASLSAAHSLGIQIAGVDIVENGDGHPVLFEVNSSPGFTLDENVSDEISKLAEFLSA